MNNGNNEIFPRELLLRLCKGDHVIYCPNQDTSESKGSSIITYARTNKQNQGYGVWPPKLYNMGAWHKDT